MFAEEEWTDSPSLNGSSLSAKLSPASGKKKAVGKQSLLKTLQTLGSVPDWEVGKAVEEDSDEEKDASTAVKKPKKKRCKKRKRKSNADNKEKQMGEEDSETPVKKKKMTTKPVKKTVKKTKRSVVSEEPKKDDEAVGAELEKNESQTEKKLSRQQWKNKMKNKRKSKNKYLPKPTSVDDTSPQKETLVQTQDVKESKNPPKPDRTSKKTSKKINKIIEKNGISSIVDNSGTCTDSKTDKTIITETIKVDDSLINNTSQEIGETDKHAKKTKKLQAEKLRRILKSKSSCTDSNKVTKTPEDAAVDVKGVEEKTAPLDPSTALRLKMEKQLEAARFRFINEQLYTSTSAAAKRMFQQDPEAITIYHKGYTTQVQHWPTNPVDSIISYICQKPASLVVADFGCGDCKIARSVKNKVHSFDLAPVCDLATACDMAKVPLGDSTVNIAVFCLSLMGTNLGDFLAEANRVLVMGGVLKIAEVASRFENVHSFVRALSNMGFKIVNKDTENSHFFSFEFIKTRKAPENTKKFGLQLKPCLYKKR
ncbi:ribosomal RNA-processing protein 8 [Danio aesculapii]|uniref:ribosomal RNA-processing protein 8 n=1 Tax=Danio aesculapii TaxID=1142201 RepID=UPI0024C0DCC0|nr:ribosomal RNA-processing protein 8 [Danio aesculapii]